MNGIEKIASELSPFLVRTSQYGRDQSSDSESWEADQWVLPLEEAKEPVANENRHHYNIYLCRSLFTSDRPFHFTDTLHIELGRERSP